MFLITGNAGFTSSTVASGLRFRGCGVQGSGNQSLWPAKGRGFEGFKSGGERPPVQGTRNFIP